jgi:tetratricopeptide (TPR) repeat protein
MRRVKRENAETLAVKKVINDARSKLASGGDKKYKQVLGMLVMVKPGKSRTIETLLDQGKWKEARKAIEQELVKSPDSHWLLTQLGVTHYEERDYREALRLFRDSLEIVPDCPLTLWNLAGVLDTLGHSDRAIPIYASLLRSKQSARSDACWESAEWTEALKTDCVYRVGMCFEHAKQWDAATHCFRQYINLLLAGMKGMYPIEDAARRIRELSRNGRSRHVKEMREAIESTLQHSDVRSIRARLARLPADLDALLAR